jgi:hypothetical protein
MNAKQNKSLVLKDCGIPLWTARDRQMFPSQQQQAQ